MDIKIIFKTYLKIFQILKQTFVIQTSQYGFQKLFLKTIFYNYFLKRLSNKTLAFLDLF